MSNGQDLDGEYAFDKVLDNLLEVTKKAAAHPGEIAEYRAREAAARERASSLQLEVNSLKGQIKTIADGETAFTKLYDVIDLAVPSLRASSEAADHALADDLSAAMKAAKKYIDPIPF